MNGCARSTPPSIITSPRIGQYARPRHWPFPNACPSVRFCSARRPASCHCRDRTKIGGVRAMTVKGAAALIRLAANPKCEVLGAMVMQEGSEKKFYERVIGAPYDREFGERQSSRRRGAQFEQNAYAGDARLRREAIAAAWGLDPDAITVRDLMDSYPGG